MSTGRRRRRPWDRSDVEDDARPPPARRLTQGELVVGHALEFRIETVPQRVNALAGRRGVHAAIVDGRHVELAGDDPARLGTDEQVLEPVVQQLLAAGGVDPERDPLAWLDGPEVEHEAEHPQPRALEEGGQRRRLDLDSEIRRVRDLARHWQEVPGTRRHRAPLRHSLGGPDGPISTRTPCASRGRRKVTAPPASTTSTPTRPSRSRVRGTSSTPTATANTPSPRSRRNRPGGFWSSCGSSSSMVQFCAAN